MSAFCAAIRVEGRCGWGSAGLAGRAGSGLFLRRSVRCCLPESSLAVFEVVVKAAEDAASHMMHRVGAEVAKTKINSRDLLTEVDPECQEIIERHMRSEFPDHGILGEETTPSGRQNSINALETALKDKEWLWIVDPIDGTTNFVHGQPMSAVSIGVTYKGELVLGVIVDPYRSETFAAMKGKGTTLNGEPVTVSNEQTAAEALVAAGSPTATDSLHAVIRGLAVMMPEVRSMRMLGSAAVMYGWVACGRLTAYWEPDLHSWDSAAGAILVTEAGGRITDLHGNDYTVGTRSLLASNLWTHEALRGLLLRAEVHNL
uniref:Inositol-1-monophosphatase n=1 Tax=Rhodosorus marinus TaxID=101924 RepID=A0A7S0G5P7_9RHOD|mmetsp:Transcript_21759/g.31563  ORF Transcript_21759/g.31563 Transcript_21759/m.31563 type:complete len:316 (+) Transcript_21759:92-1039(+)